MGKVHVVYNLMHVPYALIMLFLLLFFFKASFFLWEGGSGGGGLRMDKNQKRIVEGVMEVKFGNHCVRSIVQREK